MRRLLITVRSINGTRRLGSVYDRFRTHDKRSEINNPITA